MLKRLKLLRRLQEVDLASPEESLALLDRVTTHTSSAEDRARLAHLIRVTLEVTDHIRVEPDKQTPLVSERLSAKQKTTRHRRVTKAARRRHRRSR